MKSFARIVTRIACLVPILMCAMVAHAQGGSEWNGMWMGRTTGAREMDVIVDVVGGAAPAVKVSVPAAGFIDEAFQGVTLDATQLKGSWNPGVGRFVLTLTRAPAPPDTAEGTVVLEAPGLAEPMTLPVTLERRLRAESVPGAESWVATLELPGAELQLGLVLAEVPGKGTVGALSVPAQRLHNLPVYVQNSNGALDIRVPVGESARMLLARAQDRLEGRFQQGGADIAVVFTKGNSAPRGKRPQTPTGPLPYSSTEVSIPHPSGHILAGTLTLPAGASATARVPGVVLATGSGAQDRNESLAEIDHQPFLVLADALTRAGIAVLRFDDRGVGQSTGTFTTATTEDFATDLDAAFETMKLQPAVNAAKVGLLGHSEGGILASLAAAKAAEEGRKDPPAFVVLMAGPGVAGHAVLRAQNEAILRANKVPEAKIQELCKAQQELLDGVLAGLDDAALLPLATRLVNLQLQEQRDMGVVISPAQEAAIAQGAAASLNAPWMKTFLRLDPAVSLRKVKVPVLVLNGALDTQVLASQNLPPIRAALAESGSKATIREYPGLNHLFQPAKTGGIAEYGTIEVTMDPMVMNDIATWIRQQTGISTPWTPMAVSAGESAPAPTPPAAR